MRNRRSGTMRGISRRTFLKAVGAGAAGLGFSRYTMPATPARAGFANLLPGGYLSTSGAQIVSQDGVPVRLAGVNWYGFDCDTYVAGGLNFQPLCKLCQLVVSLGFNVIRLPFAVDVALNNPPVADAFVSADPSLFNNKTRTALDCMDALITTAGNYGLKVILDSHRAFHGWSTQENGLWYARDPDFKTNGKTWTTQDWTNAWVYLVNHYKNTVDPWGNPIVIGCDLHNEPSDNPNTDPTSPYYWPNDSGAGWGGGGGSGSEDWRQPATALATTLLSSYNNPNLLMFIEGVRTDLAGPSSNSNHYWPGGNLSGVITRGDTVTLSVTNKLVYSVHDYGPDNSQTDYLPWTSQQNTPLAVMQSCYQVWDQTWGKIAKGYTDQFNVYHSPAPIWIGEFGTTNTARAGNSAQYYVSPNQYNNLYDANPYDGVYQQGAWFCSLVQYIYDNSVANGSNSIHWCYWAVNGTQSAVSRGFNLRYQDADDWYGILNDGWTDAESADIMTRLRTIQ